MMQERVKKKRRASLRPDFERNQAFFINFNRNEK